jgi:L-lactate dehydrogenase complex protein LldG
LINRLLSWMEQDEASRKGAVVENGQESSVLAWDPDLLPIEGFGPALTDLELTLVAPRDLRTAESRDQVRFIRYGITGVEAAFASTGTMLMHSSGGCNRAASLLPLRHVALIPLSRLYPTVESWLAEKRAFDDLVGFVRSHANLTLITGPSKSADIEMNLTLGVHGPKFVHAILFDDVP